MSTRQTSIDEDDFQAFVDGQLPPERCRAVMAYLATHSDESARMSDYRALSEDLHATFDEVLYEPLPVRLQVQHYRGRATWRERLQRWIGFGVYGLTPRLVALTVLLVASAAGGWWMHSKQVRMPGETPAENFARQAVYAHLIYAPDSRHPVEFGADQQESLLWLSERLGETMHVPTLQDVGFGLVGGRLLPATDGKPAAQLMYEDMDGRRVTLYVRSRWSTPLSANQPEGSVIRAIEGELGLVYWVEGPFAYALMGEMDPDQLFATAGTIQQQVVRPVVPPPTEQTATTEKDAT